MNITRKPVHPGGWVALPLNVLGGMPLGPRSFGYHDTDGQSQRVIGRHVYIMQRTPAGLTAWRSEMADEASGYRWTLAHSWPPAVTGGRS